MRSNVRAGLIALAFAGILTACAGDSPRADSVLLLPMPVLTLSEEAVPGGSMDSLLEYARRRNPEYAAMRSEADAAAARASVAGTLPDPRLRVELQDFIPLGMQSVAAKVLFQWMQELPWFGKRELQRDIATLEAEGATGRAQATWMELAARIKSGYVQYYVIHQNERLAQKNVEFATGMEKVTRARYAAGLASLSDVLQAQGEKAAGQTELVALENDKRTIQSRLNMLLARPPDAPLAEPVALRRLPLPARLDYAALTERLRVRSPQIAVEEVRVKAAEKSRDLTYKNRYPDFTFGMAPATDGKSIKSVDAMVEFNVPLQQSSRRAQEREAEAMLSAARLRKDAALNRAVAELAENLSSLEAARRTESLIAIRLLPQAELGYRVALAGYASGTAGFASVFDAQRRIRSVRLDQIKAQVDAQTRVAEIERLLGEDL